MFGDVGYETFTHGRKDFDWENWSKLKEKYN